MTDTPRTDAATCGKGYGIPGNTVTAEFARTLERELAKESRAWVELKCELALSTESDDETAIVTVRRMSKTITSLRADSEKLTFTISRLEEALHEARGRLHEFDREHRADPPVEVELETRCKACGGNLSLYIPSLGARLSSAELETYISAISYDLKHGMFRPTFPGDPEVPSDPPPGSPPNRAGESNQP